MDGTVPIAFGGLLREESGTETGAAPSTDGTRMAGAPETQRLCCLMAPATPSGDVTAAVLQHRAAEQGCRRNRPIPVRWCCAAQCSLWPFEICEWPLSEIGRCEQFDTDTDA
jgi:hypothetical protein